MNNAIFSASRSSARSISLPAAARIAWFLDVDGTLLDLAATPAAVRCDAPLRALLVRLQHSAGDAVALVSGRSTTAVDALFAPLRLPVAGQHGVERRSMNGDLHNQPVDNASLVAVRSLVAAWMAPRAGLLLEDKGHSLALHYRQAPAHEAEIREFLELMVAGGAGELSLQSGKMVLEIKPADADKGLAIRDFLGEVPFQGRVPVFLGDDQTDEAGFLMVNSLGGVSIKVGEGATAATRRLPDVSAVRVFLAAAARSET